MDSGDDGDGFKQDRRSQADAVQAAEAKMVSEIAAYKHLEARANFRAELEAEKQPSYDKDQEELVELRKAKLAAEIRTELKLEFKVKKKKLNQQLENSQEITTIAREGHQAEQAERIKDLKLSISKEHPQPTEQVYGRQMVGPGQWAQQQGSNQLAQLQGPRQLVQQLTQQ